MTKPWQEAKERLFKIMDDIEYLKKKGELSFEEELTLRNLEVQKMDAWSDWKDPK